MRTLSDRSDLFNFDNTSHTLCIYPETVDPVKSLSENAYRVLLLCFSHCLVKGEKSPIRYQHVRESRISRSRFYAVMGELEALGFAVRTRRSGKALPAYRLTKAAWTTLREKDGLL